MALSTQQIQRLAPAPQRLARALIAVAKEDVERAMELGIRLGNDQAVNEIRATMNLSADEYRTLRGLVERAARRLG